MGEIESRVRRRARKQNIQEAVLKTIAGVGILALAMAAPNTLRLLKYTSLGRSRGRYRINSVLSRLVERGEIAKTLRDGRVGFSLTAKGRARLARLEFGEQDLRKRKWDGRWRIVIFDIPERYRRARDLLRGTLVSIGFCKLQDSVWVYPHDCEDLIALLKTDFSVGKHVLYIVGDHVEGDWKLKKHFGLA
ncbi:hypothetical protein A3F27_02275 [Candidatus Kaiserbacteria bacterium RIFCSPHIGHO2_12_FULL_53_13]|uniref:Transcriptional repressor PaaX-like central Cas2-like domain-containing protein n=1 Tax=Candidatus Kaiserbacteria bacterium RIFCSPHIGHO2_12_FULL_53_13 TaxID=1798502 RepID=A0A1F6EDN3_9BACT|nr:MAG: hypothetical protein A3F27_02275 [Candidatus Kaiserbacteria bacterium RIFCSPHIGHO2_12_FULL_53_13]OGG74660.1 MAG: hypothetical protein A3A37_01000 [Candidatus Kaiserbacteria bacterium RIFCSPLOWO2_01_FULL_52_36]